MRMRTQCAVFASALGLLLAAKGTTAAVAQATPAAPAAAPAEPGTRVGNLVGSAERGKKHYRRYCAGCHGDQGNGLGENAAWIDPKPRDFTTAMFECRSTPTGTLPTDEDLYNSVSRGFVTTNMPPWFPLPKQTRIDAVAYIKTFSPRWATQGHGTPITIPPETPVTMESILHGRELFQKMECWKCHGPAGHGDGPSATTLLDSKDNPIRPYNFGNSSRTKCGSTNEDLYRVFMTGLDGTPMPSFVDNLQPAEAWDLVHFLRTLQPDKSPESLAWHAWLPSHANELKPIGPQEAGQ